MARQGLPLTPAILGATYEFLRATPPFSRWKLPHADEIEFRVTRHSDCQGKCITTFVFSTNGRAYKHVIAVSELKIGRTFGLIELMAHEMVHVRCHRMGHMRLDHCAVFKRHAAMVCRVHGFDPKLF